MASLDTRAEYELKLVGVRAQVVVRNRPVAVRVPGGHVVGSARPAPPPSRQSRCKRFWISLAIILTLTLLGLTIGFAAANGGSGGSVGHYGGSYYSSYSGGGWYSGGWYSGGWY